MQVFGNKYQSKLLEIIDAKQVLDIYMHFNIILSYIILLIITFSCAYFVSLVLWSVMLYAFLILLSLMMLNLFSLCQRVAWISGWQLYMCRSGRLPTIWQGTLEKPRNIKGILSFVMLCWATCESLKITFRVRQFLFQLRSTTHVNTFRWFVVARGGVLDRLSRFWIVREKLLLMLNLGTQW